MLINENVIIRNKILNDSTMTILNSKSVINDSDSEEQQQQQLNEVISSIDLNENEVIDDNETITMATNEIDIESQGDVQVEDQQKNLNNPAAVRPCQFSISRVKNIMKLDPELSLTSKESVFLVAKATVSFLKLRFK